MYMYYIIMICGIRHDGAHMNFIASISIQLNVIVPYNELITALSLSFRPGANHLSCYSRC